MPNIRQKLNLGKRIAQCLQRASPPRNASELAVRGCFGHCLEMLEGDLVNQLGGVLVCRDGFSYQSVKRCWRLCVRIYFEQKVGKMFLLSALQILAFVSRCKQKTKLESCKDFCV